MSQPVSEVVVAPVTAAAPARYPDAPNSLQITRTSPWIWLALAAACLLTLLITLLAVRHNPLYSDVATNGMSKYQFIEECKDLIHAEVAKQAATQPDMNLSVKFNARDLVAGATDGFQSASVPGSNTLSPRTPGWTLMAPMQVQRAGYPAQPGVLGCQYQKGGQVSLIGG